MKFLKLTLFFIYFSNVVVAQNYSIVDIKSILINGKVPITTTKKTVIDFFEKDYSKEKFEPGCGFFDQEEFYKVKFFSYKKHGIEFIVYNSVADFQEIDFSKSVNNFVQIGKNKISSQTTIEDLKKYFPKSYKIFQEEYKKEKNSKEFYFRLDYDKESVDKFIIQLNNKKNVTTCSYWSPC